MLHDYLVAYATKYIMYVPLHQWHDINQRDNHAAYAFIKRLIKQFGKPQKVIIDQAPSTKALAIATFVEGA
jgi:hypothetical protein